MCAWKDQERGGAREGGNGHRGQRLTRLISRVTSCDDAGGDVGRDARGVGGGALACVVGETAASLSNGGCEAC